MKIKVKKTIESEQEVMIPFFLKDKEQEHVIAVLDEKTFIKITKVGDFTNLVHTYPELYANEINAAWAEYISMSEEEFFEYYQAVLDSISLQPKLVS